MFQTCFKPYPMFKEISIVVLFQPFHYLTCLKSLKKFPSTICIEQVVMLELVTNDCTCFKCFEIVCLFISDLSFFLF
jgi:hypothetical protein